MESLINAFGIDARLISIQVLNFIILAAGLSYLLYRPILKIVSEREDKIKQGIDDAKKATVALETAEDEKKVILASAHKEAEEVSGRAEVHATEKANTIISSAEAAASDKLRLADERSQALAEEAKRASEAEIAKMAVLAAEEILTKKG